MIDKPGLVIVTPDHIDFQFFQFNHVNYNEAIEEAIDWAINRLQEEKGKLNVSETDGGS